MYVCVHVLVHVHALHVYMMYVHYIHVFVSHISVYMQMRGYMCFCAFVCLFTSLLYVWYIGGHGRGKPQG